MSLGDVDVAHVADGGGVPAAAARGERADGQRFEVLQARASGVAASAGRIAETTSLNATPRA